MGQEGAEGALTLADHPTKLQPHSPGNLDAPGPLNLDWDRAFKMGPWGRSSHPAGGGWPGAGGLSKLVYPTPCPSTFTAPRPGTRPFGFALVGVLVWNLHLFFHACVVLCLPLLLLFLNKRSSW